MVRRAEVLRRIRTAAKAAGVEMTEQELTNHTGITVGGISTTVSRNSGDFGHMAEVIFKQLEPALGKGWWRR